MIDNQIQYGVTLSQIARFRKALAQLEATAPPEGVHPRMWQAQKDGVRSMLESLENEVSEYGAPDRVQAGNP